MKREKLEWLNLKKIENLKIDLKEIDLYNLPFFKKSLKIILKYWKQDFFKHQWNKIVGKFPFIEAIGNISKGFISIFKKPENYGEKKGLKNKIKARFHNFNKHSLKIGSGFE